MKRSQAATSLLRLHTYCREDTGSCWETMHEHRWKPKTPPPHPAHTGDTAKGKGHPDPCQARGSNPLHVLRPWPSRGWQAAGVLPCRHAISQHPAEHPCPSGTLVPSVAPRACALFSVEAGQCQGGGAAVRGAAAWLTPVSHPKDTQPAGAVCSPEHP